MAKLLRVYQKVFGSNAGPNEMNEFGSLADGAAVTTTDITQVQNYSQFLDGWFSAVVGANAPAIEDMNALFWLCFYQLAYHFEAGVPEWDNQTEYFNGSFVQSGGVIYISLQNSNINKALTNGLWWAPYTNAAETRILANISTRLWTAETAPGGSSAFYSIAYSSSLNRFVATGWHGSGTYTSDIMYSDNGITWTSATSALPTNTTNGICRGQNKFVIVTGAGGSLHKVITSSDGITWTDVAATVTGSWSAVCYSPDLTLFVAVSTSSDGSQRVMTSPDAVTWTTRGPTVGTYPCVVWVSELGLFIAGRSANITGNIMTSPDGITWTQRTGSQSMSVFSLAWSAALGKVIAVGTNGSTMYSSDGINWSNGQSLVTDVGGVVWSPELKVFVAVNALGGGTTDRLWVSFDGLTWTRRNSTAAASFTAIAWGNNMGLFAAVSAGTDIMISR